MNGALQTVHAFAARGTRRNPASPDGPIMPELKSRFTHIFPVFYSLLRSAIPDPPRELTAVRPSTKRHQKRFLPVVTPVCKHFSLYASSDF
jgi:hypothetical protein